MAPSMVALAANRRQRNQHHGPRHGDARHQQFAERERSTYHYRQESSRENRRPAPVCSPHLKWPVTSQDAHHRHIEDVGPQREHAAVLEHEGLDGDDHRHHQNRRSGAQCEREQRSTHQVPAGSDSDWEIDHLRGEHERAHHAQQRDARVVQLAAGLAHHESHGGNG